MRRALVVLTVLAFALGACDLRAEIEVNDDGSGTMGMVFALEPEMIALLDQQGLGVDPFAEMRADFADDPVDWTVQDFREGKLRGIRATFPFTSIDDLLEKMDALGENSRDAGLQDFSIVRHDGGWAFTGRSTDVGKQVGNDQIPIPAAQLGAVLTLQLRVTLPGSAAEHNADEIERSAGRTTFIWSPSFDDGAIDLRAATTPGGGSSFPVLPVALVLGAVAVVLVARFVKAQNEAAAAAGSPNLSDGDVESLAGVPSDQNEPAASGPGAPE